MQIREHLGVSRYTNTTKDTDSENYQHKLILTVASSSADTASDGGYIPSCSPKIPPHIIHDCETLDYVPLVTKIFKRCNKVRQLTLRAR